MAAPRFGEDSVLDRGAKGAPPVGGSVRPEPASAVPGWTLQIIWWDPSVLALDVERHVEEGTQDRATQSRASPAFDLRSDGDRARSLGSISQQLGMRAPVEVEMIRRGDFERPKRATLLALLSTRYWPPLISTPNLMQFRRRLLSMGGLLEQPKKEIIAAIATVRATLEHPVCEGRPQAPEKGV